AQSGENPELRTFYYRLAMLAERPVHVVFVNDGPLRPAIKRGKSVKTAPHWMTEGMRRFVDAFGFAWFEAAGEAEAELARMNELGFIDAVMTDDSDVLLFGAQVVLRNPSFKRSSADDVEVLRASGIRQLGFSRGDLLLYALLVGSDYDQVGLPRCGLRTAAGLIKYDLGRTLQTALLVSTASDFATFTLDWRHRLQKVLRTDPAGLIGRACPGLAARIPASFPSFAVADLLVRPAVSNPACYDNIRCFTLPDVARLGELCELYFTWGNKPEILKTLRSTTWLAEVVRMLIAEGLARDGVNTEV
ncbi:PIN domain-like protein, partial [Trametes sanguinea]